MRMISSKLLVATLVLAGAGALNGHTPGKTTIGRVEIVSLPRIGINISARTDTGAKSCSLHATNVEVDGDYVEFDTEDRNGKTVHVKAKIHKRANIKSSTGIASKRIIIKEQLKLGKVTKLVEISLNDRDKLNHKFLIGRNFLIGKFLVDVALSHTLDN